MFARDDLSQALKKYDALACKAVVGSDGLNDAEAAHKFIEEVRRSGIFVVKQPDAAKETKRDAVIAACREMLSSASSAAQQSFEMHVKNAKIAERGFREILRGLDASDIYRLAPDIQVWGIIDRAMREYSHVKGAMAGAMSTHGEGGLDPTQVRIRSEDGSAVDIDAVETAIVQAVGTTISLLAFKNKWFNAKGILVLPSKVATNEDIAWSSGVHTLYATMWRRLEKAWDRSRLFEAEFKLAEQTVTYPDGETRRAEVLEIEDPSVLELLDLISLTRIQKIFFSHQLEYNYDAAYGALVQSVTLDGVPLPPKALLSINEAAAGEILEHTFHVPYDDEAQLFGPLSLKLWLRGYCYFSTLARNPDGSPILECVQMAEATMMNELIAVGFNSDQASKFIALTTFQRGSSDLFDTPLLRCADGSLHFYAPAHFASVPGNIVLSRLRSLRSRGNSIEEDDVSCFEDKGRKFEDAMLKYLRGKGVSAHSFKYKTDPSDPAEYECDLAFIIDETLFVFDCKNYSLPLNKVTSLYYYSMHLEEFARQVKRIAAQFNDHPHIVTKHLGAGSVWKQTIPCVLQALPWNMGELDGVYFYDASALVRFFTGYISFHTFVNTDHGIEDREARHRLYPGALPSADELIAEMENPSQLRVEMLGWQPHRSLVQIAESFHMLLPEWRQEPAGIKKQLSTLGFNEDEIKQFTGSSTNVADS